MERWLKLRKRLSSLLGVCNNLGATVCYVERDEAQSTDNHGFTIERSVDKMWKEVKDLKIELKNSKSKKEFTAYFSAKKENTWLDSLLSK